MQISVVFKLKNCNISAEALEMYEHIASQKFIIFEELNSSSSLHDM